MAVSRIFLVLVAVIGVALAQNDEASAGDVSVKILGRSGKFTLTRGNSSLTFEFDYLKEMDKDGNAVGTSGQDKHSFNTFASQDFAFKPKNDAATFGGLDAVNLKFEATLMDSAKLTIDMYIFKEDGNVTVGNTTYAVRKGNLKFNVEMVGWSFCGCQQGQTTQTGEFIEMGITVKSPGVAKKASGQQDPNVVKFILGENEAMTLTNEVEVDGVMQHMDAGYPTVEVVGAKQTLKIQLPKMTNKVVYDPTIDMALEEEDDGNDDDGNDKTGGASAAVASLLTLVLAVVSSLY